MITTAVTPEPSARLGGRALDRYIWPARVLTATALLSTFFGRVVHAQLVFDVCALLALIIVFLNPPAFKRIPVSLVLVLLLAWTAITTLWSITPSLTLTRLPTFFAAALLSVIVGPILGVRGMRSVFSWVGRAVLIVTFATLIIIPGWATDPVLQGTEGWYGPAYHKNQFGFATAIFLLTFIEDKTMKRRRLWMLLAVVGLIGSRSSTALGVAIMCVGLLYGQRLFARLNRPGSRGTLAFVTTIGMVTGAYLGFTNVGVVTGLFGKDPTFTGRTSIWAGVWSFVLKRPLQGWGFNAIWFNVNQISVTVQRDAGFAVLSSHNGLLEVALGTGLIGVALNLGLAASGLYRSRFMSKGADGKRWVQIMILAFVIDAWSESNFSFDFVLILMVLVACTPGRNPLRLNDSARSSRRRALVIGRAPRSNVVT